MENFLRGGMAEDLEIYLDDLEKKLRNGGKNNAGQIRSKQP